MKNLASLLERQRPSFLPWLALLSALLLASCTAAKLTSKNYDAISEGMSKAQVQQILGEPTRKETKDMIIFTKTTWRYEEGKKFVMITFKNDQVDSKESNLGSDH
jgi:outer membrane protein assembly factor BamE (lipoprotein component of BamABCDE complex)